MAIVISVLGGELLELLGCPRLPKPSLLAIDADLRDALVLHGLEDPPGRVAVLLGRLEHVAGDGVDDVLGGGAGEENRLAFLADVLDRHRLAAGRGPDDRQDLLLVDELLGQGNGVSGLPPESLTISSIFWPLIPPAWLICSTSISAVFSSGAPRNDAGPVTAKIAPTLIGVAASEPPGPSPVLESSLAAASGRLLAPRADQSQSHNEDTENPHISHSHKHLPFRPLRSNLPTTLFRHDESASFLQPFIARTYRRSGKRGWRRHRPSQEDFCMPSTNVFAVRRPRRGDIRPKPPLS